MKKKFTASVWQEGQWFVAQCNEIEVASQGFNIEEAIENLKEAVELYFEEPVPTIYPKIYNFEAEVNASL